MATKPDKGDEAVGALVRAAAERVLNDPDGSSHKLVAWVYSLTPEGAENEGKLFALLMEKLAKR